jgi:hypothetical protein
LSVGQVEGFFVDTCILLPQPLDAVMKTCSKFTKEASSKFILSSSVKKEGLDLVDKSHNTIVQNFQMKLRPFLEEKKVKEITNRDGEIFASFFAEQKAQFRKLPYKRTNIQHEILSAIEGYVASQLHSIENGQKIPTEFFLAAISAELAIVKHDLEAPFRGLRCEDIQPNDSIYSAVVVSSIFHGSVLKNQNDILHLSSALEYQFQHNKWVIFVTTDEEEILCRASEFKEILLHCSRPEWAMDHYREMTKNIAPLDHLKNITNPTDRQRTLIEAIKNVAFPSI